MTRRPLMAVAFVAASCGGLGCTSGPDAQAPAPTASASRSAPAHEDFVDDYLRERAGPDAADCGQVTIRESPVTTNDCLARAYDGDNAAFGWFWQQGIDSAVGWGAVVVDDRVDLFSFDSFGCRQIRCPNGMRRGRCSDPVVIEADAGLGRLRCSNTEFPTPRPSSDDAG